MFAEMSSFIKFSSTTDWLCEIFVYSYYLCATHLPDMWRL